MTHTPVKTKEKDAVAKAEISAESLMNSVLTIQSCNADLADTATLIKKLGYQVEDTVRGDTRKVETMLMTQAQTLDVVFHKLMRVAMSSEQAHQMKMFMEMSFKAQNQCKKALTALNEIKHPKRAMFIKQQNNAINQQVNNTNNSENLKNPTNELKEINDELDTRKTSTAIKIDTPMATMEESRCQNPRRQSD